MRRPSAETQQQLSLFGALMPKLWDIALGEAEHEDLSAYVLAGHALDLLRVFLARRDPCTFAIFTPAIQRACENQDRGELARELLKLIRYVQGSDSIDKDLEQRDKLNTFSGLHNPVPDDAFATVWNHPGLEHLKPHGRANHLLKDLGSNSVENALRRVRRMVNRGWKMTGYIIGPGGRAKQVR